MALVIKHEQLPIAYVGRGLAPGVRPKAWHRALFYTRVSEVMRQHVSNNLVQC